MAAGLKELEKLPGQLEDQGAAQSARTVRDSLPDLFAVDLLGLEPSLAHTHGRARGGGSRDTSSCRAWWRGCGVRGGEVGARLFHRDPGGGGGSSGSASNQVEALPSGFATSLGPTRLHRAANAATIYVMILT